MLGTAINGMDSNAPIVQREAMQRDDDTTAKPQQKSITCGSSSK